MTARTTHRIPLLGALLLALLLGACASLPDLPDLPSPAPADPAPRLQDTTLARIAIDSTPPAKRHLSGLRLLPAGDHAFDARLALARHAERTLDAQYYVIADDAAGRQFLGRAARRRTTRRARALVGGRPAQRRRGRSAGRAGGARARRGAAVQPAARAQRLADDPPAAQPEPVRAAASAHAQQAVHRRRARGRHRRAQCRRRVLHACQRSQLRRHGRPGHRRRAGPADTGLRALLEQHPCLPAAGAAGHCRHSRAARTLR